MPFSRANIYARDEHTCQYCGRVHPTSELTFDHVVPVAMGGKKDWENIVTCCVACNRRKGGRTPAGAGMHLVRLPKRPESAPALRITIGLRQAPESWRDYLYWNVELEDDRPVGTGATSVCPGSYGGPTGSDETSFVSTPSVRTARNHPWLNPSHPASMPSCRPLRWSAPA